MRFFDQDRPRRRPTAQRGGFTITELLVSIAILMIISLSVVTDLNRSRYQEELQGTSRVIVGLLRDMQTRAQAGREVQTCTGAGAVTLVCEYTAAGCTGACGTLIPPEAYGVTFNSNATGVTAFAEVEPTRTNRRDVELGYDHENVGKIDFLKGVAGSEHVTIYTMVSGFFSDSQMSVTFERQSGTMRIDACKAPPSLYQPCGMFGEPTTGSITLRHAKTLSTKTITLNALTGRISVN